MIDILLAWGLNNQGVPQNIELDHVTSFKVQARAHQDIHLPENKFVLHNNSKVIVAVMDTGIDLSHPDLKSKIQRNEKECQALEKYKDCLKDNPKLQCESTWFDLNNPEVDTDKNGYPLDCAGWNFLGGVNSKDYRGTPEVQDRIGHGTHVAGIVSSVSDNISILPIQILDKKPSEPIKPLSTDITPTEGDKPFNAESALGDLVARGVVYAIASKAQVINFSMGWPQSFDSPYLREVIAEAQKRGIIIVAAAGNDSTRALLRPCAYPGVICVASHGPDGSLSHFSNYGSGVDIAAPGTNILSTYPLRIRPVRYRSSIGFEFLHGTSQASPFVAGIVAEMIARGIPKNEIYPRLVLASRPILQKLPLLAGSAIEQEELSTAENGLLEKKFLFSGLVDLDNALNVKPQALLKPVSKEKLQLTWDRNLGNKKVSFAFENLWKEVSLKDVSVQVSFLKPNNKAIRPEIKSFAFENKGEIWKSNEVRNLNIEFEILSKEIPSNLDFVVDLTVNGKTRRIVLESEITVSLAEIIKNEKIESIPVKGIPSRSTWNLVDQSLDESSRVDYYLTTQDEKGLSIALLKQNLKDEYEVQGALQIPLSEEDASEDVSPIEQIRTRIGDQYVFGLLMNREGVNKNSSLDFYFLDQKMKLKSKASIANDFVKIPLKVAWHNLEGQFRPYWVGLGLDPDKKPSLIDDWEDEKEKPQIRLYWIDQNNKLQALEKIEGFQILDVLDPSVAQIKAGELTLLLAKETGTENKPSYILEFATTTLKSGQVSEIMSLHSKNSTYRNYLDTRVDQILSLGYSSDQTLGSFWFGESAKRSQRLTLMYIENQSLNLLDQIISPIQSDVDAILLIRSVYYSKERAGAFAFTNRELQYHDLTQNKVVGISAERYTFYNSMAFTNLQFPIVISDPNNNSLKRPALYITEDTGFQAGVRIKAPYYDASGELIEINSPAKYRIKSERELTGCKALASPLNLKSEGAGAFDYYCGSHIKRLML